MKEQGCYLRPTAPTVTELLAATRRIHALHLRGTTPSCLNVRCLNTYIVDYRRVRTSNVSQATGRAGTAGRSRTPSNCTRNTSKSAGRRQKRDDDELPQMAGRP